MSDPTYYLYFTQELYKSDIDFGVLQKLLDKNNFVKKDIYDKNFDNKIDFLHMYELVPKELYNTKTKLKNYINDLSITNKNNLYELSYKNNKTKTKQYFIETYIYDPKKNYSFLFNKNEKNPWYIKLNVAGSGMGNMIVHNYNEFLNKLKIIKNNKNGFIINKYILNPLLFNDRKFHIRIYFINYINSKNIKKSYMSRYGQIITAKDKYIPDDFLNMDIHDTHLKTTVDGYLFPNALEKEYGSRLVNNYFKQMKTILKYISDIEELSNFQETENGYAINGCDFMITDNNIVKLLEINRKTGLSSKTLKMKQFLGNYLFKNIFNEIIADVFKLEKVHMDEKFIKL